jgi:hypothetical protein
LRDGIEGGVPPGRCAQIGHHIGLLQVDADDLVAFGLDPSGACGPDAGRGTGDGDNAAIRQRAAP